MKIRFLAGEMARLHDISKQTLIYYNKIGLLTPCEIDPYTGYRYYALEQCDDLDVILFLKSLGLSLKEIKAYRGEPSTKARLRLLENQALEIQNKIDQIHQTRNRLDAMVDYLKSSFKIQPFEKGIRWIDARPTAVEHVAPPHDLYAMEMAFKKLYKSARDHHDLSVHGFLFFTEKTGNGDNGDVLFKKVALPVSRGGSETIKAGNFAYLYHKGPFEALEESHNLLTTYIHESGHSIIGPSIERVILSSIAVSSENDYLVEIQIPVENPSPPFEPRRITH